MTKPNVKNPSIDWKEIRRRFEEEPSHVRALAREHQTTDTRIHRRAKTEHWKPYSTKLALQREAQQPSKTPMLWDFEPRRDALIAGLQRSRNGVDSVEDACYADFSVVMALLWLRTPFADIARALQIDEPMLEALYGKPILAFVREYYLPKPDRAKRRQSAHRKN
jgi:hypothetical protein